MSDLENKIYIEGETFHHEVDIIYLQEQIQSLKQENKKLKQQNDEVYACLLDENETFRKLVKVKEDKVKLLECVEYYANDKDGEVWELDESSCDYIVSIKIEDADERNIGGKRARQCLKDLGEE